MTAAAPRALEAFLARSGTAPTPARQAAAALLRERGLPGIREEAWKYTNLRPLVDIAWQAPPSNLSTDEGDLPLPGPALVFRDGRFEPALSRLPTLFRAQTGYSSPITPADSLNALNALLTEDGAELAIPAGLDAGTLLLDHRGHGEAQPVSAHPRHRIRLGAGARLALVELSRGHGTYLHAPLFDIALADGAHLRHIRLQQESAEAFHLARLDLELAANAEYDSFTLALGARLARTEIRARLTGPGAIVHLNAAQLLGGAQHGDFATIVRHEAPGCASRQTVKNVLAGHARGVFQGRIEVARAAQKTDGYQMSQALLLSPNAEIDVKPELEIYADDVKCSHGATIGELDADALFYLRSRGLPEPEARGILVRAFLADALDALGDDPARALLDAAIDQAWNRLP